MSSRYGLVQISLSDGTGGVIGIDSYARVNAATTAVICRSAIPGFVGTAFVASSTPLDWSFNATSDADSYRSVGVFAPLPSCPPNAATLAQCAFVLEASVTYLLPMAIFCVPSNASITSSTMPATSSETVEGYALSPSGRLLVWHPNASM